MKVFAITASQRTGSTLLQSLLNSHKNVLCLGELFHPNIEARKTAAERYPPITKAESGPDFLETLLERVAEKTAPEKAVQMVGFRIFYDHATETAWCPSIFDYIANSGMPVIHLRRENLLHRYVSYLLAERSQAWSSKVGAYDDDKIRVDPGGLIKDVVAQNWINGEFHRRLDANPSFDLTYEQLVSQDQARHLTEILDFLNLEHTEIASDLKKQQTTPYPELVSNWGALRDAVNLLQQNIAASD